MIERKKFSAPKEKRQVSEIPLKKVKKGFNHEALNPAIVDGKFVANIEAELIVSRFRDGKNALHLCTVKSVNDDGLISLWDETLYQWYQVSVTAPPAVFKIKA